MNPCGSQARTCRQPGACRERQRPRYVRKKRRSCNWPGRRRIDWPGERERCSGGIGHSLRHRSAQGANHRSGMRKVVPGCQQRIGRRTIAAAGGGGERGTFVAAVVGRRVVTGIVGRLFAAAAAIATNLLGAGTDLRGRLGRTLLVRRRNCPQQCQGRTWRDQELPDQHRRQQIAKHISGRLPSLPWAGKDHGGNHRSG